MADDPRVDSGHRQRPAAHVPQAARPGADPAPGRRRLGRPAQSRRLGAVPPPGEDRHGRVERAPRRAPVHAQEAADRQRDVLRQLLDREQHPQVEGDGVEAAGVHEPGAGADGRRVVPEVHAVDELRLARQVQVVRAGLGARGHERLAVPDVRPHRRDHHPRPRGQLGQRRRIGRVRVHDRNVDAECLHLGTVTACHGPRDGGTGEFGEIGGGERAGEPTGAEKHDVVRTVHGLRPPGGTGAAKWDVRHHC